MKKIFWILLLAIGIVFASQAGKIGDLEKSCYGGEAKACAVAGGLYLQGTKVKRDIAKASKLWKKGCELGNGSSCTTYAMVISDETEQIKVLKKACDLGNENGCLAYKQVVKFKRLQGDCFDKNELNSCSELAGETFIAGNYKTGKALFDELCSSGKSVSSCEDAKIIDSFKGFSKLTLISQKRKECSEKKDKYACEKVGTFLIEINSFIASNATTKEDKQAKALEVMLNMGMAQLYLKEACKLGRKEACQTLNGLRKSLETAK